MPISMIMNNVAPPGLWLAINDFSYHSIAPLGLEESITCFEYLLYSAQSSYGDSA